MKMSVKPLRAAKPPARTGRVVLAGMADEQDRHGVLSALRGETGGAGGNGNVHAVPPAARDNVLYFSRQKLAVVNTLPTEAAVLQPKSLPDGNGAIGAGGVAAWRARHAR